MAARTESVVKKTRATDGTIGWRLVFLSTRDSEPVRLQKWRVVGDGRTSREQMIEYATTFQTSHSEEGENTLVPTSFTCRGFVPSSSMTAEAEVLLDERQRGQSPSSRDSLTAEARTMPGKSPSRSRSPSSESEFNYADGYISGQEESESEEAHVDDDSVELGVMDADSFKIFQVDDEEKREPASILDLEFDCKKDHPPNKSLQMIACSSSDSSRLFMRTLDSWTIKEDGERSWRLYVRDTKGSWIKLCNPSKGYDASVHDALIISSFLELAMNVTTANAVSCLDELVIKNGSSKDDIKTVLWKSYNSVVKNFVKLPRAPPSLQQSPIIETMESLLKNEVLKEQNVPAVKASSNKRRRVAESHLENGSDDGDQRGINSKADAMPTSNKRKRVVESDPENESDSDDHIPLAKRNFQPAQRLFTNKLDSGDECVEDTMNNNESHIECGSERQDQGNGASADLPLSPPSSKDDGPSRWSEDDIDYRGDQEFQDIAEIYGGQNNGLSEIEDDGDENLGNSACCAICDDGGDLLFCDGPCLRSFHASEQAAADSESMCSSLGYTAEEVQEMGSWWCPNCLHKQHQCFICGLLGRSEGTDKEVFVCAVALCGRFYHPDCLATWKKNEKFNGIVDKDAFIQSVKEGVEEFCCPAHKCRKCGEDEVEGGADNSMKLAKCRRCPKAYHKICLPKKISFDSRGDEPQRAWELGDEDNPMTGLIIYCLDHVIVEDLSTPHRNHLDLLDLPRKTEAHEDDVSMTRHQKLPKGSSSRQKALRDDDVEIIDHLSKVNRNCARMPKVPIKWQNLQDDLYVGKPSRLIKPNMGLNHSVKAGKDKGAPSILKRQTQILEVNPVVPSVKDVHKRRDFNKKNVDVLPILNREAQHNRVFQFLQQASQSVTLETVKKDLMQPICYGENKKKNMMHRGELVSITNAIKKAVEKVKNGGSIEDAKRLCPRDNVVKMLRAEDALKIYLAPFLHGMRYTSFGRHFTCVDKLNEIVERIHPYIDDGDMVVDFCCGANDFSVLLNKKLLSIGKTCHFMNFDIHPPKNGFCFTKGDWLANRGRDFFEGKRLIMGLNPPFGVRAALADQFIQHALTFRPKLLVLIVPPETMSFSKEYRRYNYDLVWEDKELLRGHAFYLPGSVDDKDEKNNMTQWNVVTPPLYLWSSNDMIDKHKQIALEYKHIERLQGDAPGPPLKRASSPSPPAREIPRLKVPPDNRTTPLKRASTPSPPAREIPRLKVPPDNRTNSGSTPPTECDTSSSRLQHSSATSSRDENSQNSLDGVGPGHAVKSQKGPVQISSHGRQDSGEKPSSHHGHLQRSFSRTGMGPVSAGHNPLPAVGIPHNHNIPNLSYQHHVGGPRRSNPEVLQSHGGLPGRSGPPHADSRGNMTASEVHANCINLNLNQSTGQAFPPQWGRVDHQSRYHHNDRIAQRIALDNGGQVHPIGLHPHEQPPVEPHWYKNTRVQPVLPNPLPPHSLLAGHPNGGLQQPLPGQTFPQAWQGMYPGCTNLQPQVAPGFGFGGPISVPRQDVYLPRVPHRYERTSGGGQHGGDQGNGGWLD